MNALFIQLSRPEGERVYAAVSKVLRRKWVAPSKVRKMVVGISSKSSESYMWWTFQRSPSSGLFGTRTDVFVNFPRGVSLGASGLLDRLMFLWLVNYSRRKFSVCRSTELHSLNEQGSLITRKMNEACRECHAREAACSRWLFFARFAQC